MGRAHHMEGSRVGWVDHKGFRGGMDAPHGGFRGGTWRVQGWDGWNAWRVQGSGVGWVHHRVEQGRQQESRGQRKLGEEGSKM